MPKSTSESKCIKLTNLPAMAPEPTWGCVNSANVIPSISKQAMHRFQLDYYCNRFTVPGLVHKICANSKCMQNTNAFTSSMSKAFGTHQC